MLLVCAFGPRLIDFTPIPRSDQVLFGALAAGIGVIWAHYRRAGSAETRLRLAALAALVSVVLLSVTAAMPWFAVDGTAYGEGRAACLLGREAVCTGAAAGAALFELEQWKAASAALRMGQVTALALLLPALIWLLVDPRHRAAQAASAVGASVAGFTVLTVFLYVEAVPTWLDAQLYWTADLALLACTTIIVAAVLIVRQAFALLAGGDELPRAAASYRRR